MTAVRPYVDRRVDDLGAAERLAARLAKDGELPQPTLLRHGMNAIFRAGDVVIRVATPTAPVAAAIELAHRLLDAEIRVNRPIDLPPVEEATRGGPMVASAWEHLAEVASPIDWCTVGHMVRRVHQIDPATLPAALPTPSPVDFPWWDFDRMLEAVGEAVDQPARAGMLAALERHAAWREFRATVVCHGDVHPGNVIMTGDGPVLIDWDLLCLAPPGWDHGPLMTWTERWGGEPGLYDRFADGFGRSMRGERFAESFAELRLLAATLMRVLAGLADEAAMPEAQRRLAYWRGDPAAPVWRAQ